MSGCQDKPLWVELKTNGGVIVITILLLIHYFISLETEKKSEAFLLRISLGNVNGLVVDILKFTISVLEKNF